MVHSHCPEKNPLWDSSLCEHSNFSRETQEAEACPERRKWASAPAPASEREAPAAQAPHRQGSGEARRACALARAIRASRRDDDPGRAPAWAADGGAVRAPLGSSRSGTRPPTRAASQERDGERASDGRRRDTRAEATGGDGSRLKIALRPPCGQSQLGIPIRDEARTEGVPRRYRGRRAAGSF